MQSKVYSEQLDTYNRSISGLLKEETNRMCTIFHSCDEGLKGFLNRQDFKVAVVTIFGYKPSKFEVDRIFGDMETKYGEEVIEKGLKMNHFLEVVSNKMTAVDEKEEIRQIFLAFDTLCQGFLTKADFTRALQRVAPHLAENTGKVDTLFKEVDRDGDGRVSYRDFEFMMLYEKGI